MWNASEKTGTVAVTETGATGIVQIALYSLSDFEVVGVILLESPTKIMRMLAQSPETGVMGILSM